GIFHLALLDITREADVMMRPQDQAGPFTSEKLPDRLHLFWCRFLFRDHVIQAEHHERVRVRKNSFVDRQFVSGLVDPLKDGYGVATRLAHYLLERHPGLKK